MSHVADAHSMFYRRFNFNVDVNTSSATIVMVLRKSATRDINNNVSLQRNEPLKLHFFYLNRD